jgi:pheromone shutdown protein TraB
VVLRQLLDHGEEMGFPLRVLAVVGAGHIPGIQVRN